MVRRIAVLTGGGDVPGLNVAIKTLTYRMVDENVEVLGLRRGWASVLEVGPGSTVDPADWVWHLDKQSTRTIDRTGGTILHTSRTNPAAIRPADLPAHLRAEAPAPDASGKVDMTAAAIRTLESLGIDMLVAIGGDDTLSFARRLHEAGAKVVAIPKTMDNDVRGTDFCIGFSTAVTRSVEMITNLRTPAGSHERFMVVELFGRNSGETSLITALLAGVDRALISEVPYDADRVVDLLVADRSANPSHYAMVTISEGAHPAGGQIVQTGEADAFGHQKLGGVGQAFADYLKARSGVGIMFQSLTYLMRGGPADTLDRMVAINFARLAADLVLRGQSGLMTAVREGRYTTTDLSEVGTRKIDVERYYDAHDYRPRMDSPLGRPMFLE
jgi:ATP-dependent phosphofructokinase / diphosphate-dependent phosphofructokinase